jgi:AcrR family transcriptional regulator
MPRLIDWGVRFELIREAVVRVAARDGVAAVSIASVAAELHVSGATLRRTLDSPDVLPRMGAESLARERRYRRYIRGRPPGVEHGSVEHVVWILVAELPRDEQDLEQQRAWVQLTGTGASKACAELRSRDEDYLDALMPEVLGRLGTLVATRSQQAIRLRALIDGLVAALCREGVSVDDAVECLETFVRELPLERASGVSPDAA